MGVGPATALYGLLATLRTSQREALRRDFENRGGGITANVKKQEEGVQWVATGPGREDKTCVLFQSGVSARVRLPLAGGKVGL